VWLTRIEPVPSQAQDPSDMDQSRESVAIGGLRVGITSSNNRRRLTVDDGHALGDETTSNHCGRRGRERGRGDLDGV